ncbi:hypothetical protein AGMMS49525_05570 [Bacteroidia bacterium]|nr:hypothetical protein AGMMS49525_05570 [Bacteroidia bacterium]
MKQKHTYIIATVLLLFFLFSAPSYAQENTIEIKKNKIHVKDDVVTIDFDIILKGLDFPSDFQITFTPVLRSKFNKKRLKHLPPMIVNGKNRNNLYKRSLSLNGVSKDPAVYSVTVAKGRLTQISYAQTIPFELWMDVASLYLLQDMTGCCDSSYDHGELLIAGSIDEQGAINYTYTPEVSFIAPSQESIKERRESGEAYLFFKQGKSDILPNFQSNKAELAKIDNSLQYVKDEPEAVIKSVSIKAYASPEGVEAANVALSDRRAKSLLSYVSARHHFLSRVNISAVGLGEDWEKLALLVETDHAVPNKMRVLTILNTPLYDREQRIKELDGGKTYQYIYDVLYPRLRRSDYVIEYTVPNFSIERGKELLKTRARMLSLYEMFTIANTYPKGSPEFCEVFEIARTAYPNNQTANLNAAAAAILSGNEDEAFDILSKYRRDPATWNNIGVIYMNRHEFDDAEGYFNQAMKNGSQEAAQNLQIMTQLKAALDEYNN